MPNQTQPIDYEEAPFDSVRAFTKIKKFLDKIDPDDWENPHKFIIEECFPIGKPEPYYANTYELYNIKLDIENDGIAYFDDGEGVLLEAMYNDSPLPLQAIVMDKVIYASINKYYMWVTISYNNGYIRIKY